MKRLTTLISAFLFLILGVSQVWALPNCVGPWSVTTWDNCFGTYTFSNGSKYVGEFKDGKKHGQGTFTYFYGDKYVGEYKDDKQHGQGTFTFASGSKYVGNFKDGDYHGQGTYTFANGEKWVGTFERVGVSKLKDPPPLKLTNKIQSINVISIQ